MNPDPLLLNLKIDLLANIIEYAGDIKKCADNITSQIREIIGTQIVAFFELSPKGDYDLISACPYRKGDIFNRALSKSLITQAGFFDDAMLVRPGEDEIGQIIADLGLRESFFVPLRVGDESFGMLVLLDLMDNQGIAHILEALQDISGLLSLVLKNSFLYRNMEMLVEQKTSKLMESESRSRIILQTAMDGFWRVDSKGRLLEVNDAYCKMVGYDHAELLTMTIHQLEANESAQAIDNHIREVLSGKNDRFETRHLRKDGSYMNLEICTQVYSEGDTREIVVFLRDITDRKQAEEANIQLQEQLMQAQKMQAVGQLAGGVAHDFNNMLGVIIGYSELILEQVDPCQQFHAELEEIQKAARRSADLTRQLLTFARKQTVALQVLDLNHTIEGMLNMLRRLIGENINLIWKPGTGLWPINMDPSQIDQILANLCVNARDAITGVGKLTVETENTTFDKEYCATHAGSLPGEYVRIAVSDTGRGMDKETLAHIFEPFFTTKGVGEGTGLGLATVFGAVNQNNGFINAYSEPDQGTTFTIYIPRHVEKTTQTQTTASAKPVLHGDEIIMLAEDEPTVLEMSKTILERLGYTVFAASTPSEAIRLADEYSGKIHLLATDVIMPEMNGRELAERLGQSRPEMKCLFMSGYTANIIANQGVLKEGVLFIQKPFSKNELAIKVRDALDS